MKITDKDYQHIKTSLQGVIDSYGLTTILNYKQKLIDGTIKCNDVNTRLMYDLQRQAGLLSFVWDTIYQYAEDSHYKTALIKAGKELNII